MKVKVEKGVVTLSGNLEWYYQRSAAEADLRKLPGVIGLNNDILIKPRVQASNVRDQIKAALKRRAQIEADHITVTTDGSKVTLGGKVNTWYERRLAESTAWEAPGVTQVENRLTVGRHPATGRSGCIQQRGRHLLAGHRSCRPHCPPAPRSSDSSSNMTPAERSKSSLS